MANAKGWVAVVSLIGAVACGDDDGSGARRTDAGVDNRSDAAEGVGRDARWRPPAPLAMTREFPAQAPWFNVYRPEDLAAIEAPMPVVVWANGVCSRSDFTWEILFRRWVSAGFVVLALTERPGHAETARTTVDDQAALVDWAFEQNETDGPYFGKLATDRIVAAGNSCGGVTTLALTARDERIAAAFVLSGSSGVGSADRSIIDRIEVPVGYIVGGDTDIVGANVPFDYDALADEVPAIIVSRFEGDHTTVSTDRVILVDVAKIALSWMELALFGSRDAHAQLTSPSVCDGCKIGDYALQSKHLQSLLR